MASETSWNVKEDWPSQRFREHVLSRMKDYLGSEENQVEGEIFEKSQSKDEYVKEIVKAINEHYRSPIQPVTTNQICSKTTIKKDEKPVSLFRRKNYALSDIVLAVVFVQLLWVYLLPVVNVHFEQFRENKNSFM